MEAFLALPALTDELTGFGLSLNLLRIPQEPVAGGLGCVAITAASTAIFI